MKKILIVVIAIVAVLALILGAIYVIGQNNYKEQSNMEADEASMLDIANAIKLSVYDETVASDICKEIEANAVDGEMTITFQPASDNSYNLSDAFVNCPTLYTKLNSLLGNTIELKSRTYKNSEYIMTIQINATDDGVTAHTIHGEFLVNLNK